MKKFLILALLICLPAQAEQFKYIGNGYTLNKDKVFYVQKVSKNSINIQSSDNGFTLKYKTVQDRNKAYNEIVEWLNK